MSSSKAGRDGRLSAADETKGFLMVRQCYLLITVGACTAVRLFHVVIIDFKATAQQHLPVLYTCPTYHEFASLSANGHHSHVDAEIEANTPSTDQTLTGSSRDRTLDDSRTIFCGCRWSGWQVQAYTR